jgi:hypothetical protein
MAGSVIQRRGACSWSSHPEPQRQKQETKKTDSEPREVCVDRVYARRKKFLICLWVVSTFAELYFWWPRGKQAVHYWWMGYILLFTNVWGQLDAVLRFPLLHDIDSLFLVKNSLVLIVKVLWFTCAFVQSDVKYPLWYLVFFLWQLVLYVVYVVLLPLDDSDLDQRLAVAGVGVEDVDICILLVRHSKRVAKMMSQPKRQLHYLRLLAYKAFASGVEAARETPHVGRVLEELSPKSKKRCV